MFFAFGSGRGSLLVFLPPSDEGHSHAINKLLLIFTRILGQKPSPAGLGNPVTPLTDTRTSERRSSARRAADWRVLFGPPDQLVPGFLADMSPIGVSILSEIQYPVGTEIEVHFGVHDDRPAGKLQMQAVVRYSGKGRLGVQFLNMEPAQRDHWWKIMRSDF